LSAPGFVSQAVYGLATGEFATDVCNLSQAVYGLAHRAPDDFGTHPSGDP